MQAAHDIGLFVRVCISAMGPSNRNMWKTVGVFSRRNSTSNYIQHPCTSTATDRLYFMADTPHLLKNLRNCLLTQMIVLPPSTVVKAGLPHNQVSMEHVRQLVDLQDDMQLKVAPKLTKAHVAPGQYQKMRVNMAAAVLSHSTASALRFCASTNLLSQDVLATAWFLDLANRWFDAMNARLIKASLFTTSQQKLGALHDFVEVICNVKFTGRDSWKPVQSGIQLSTASVLDLYNDLVCTGRYKYLMTGRLTQDCVENLFSCIRGRGDTHPSPVQFRHNLRIVSLSQFMHIDTGSSYDADDSCYFLQFLKTSSLSTACREDDQVFVEQEILGSSSVNICDLEAKVCYLLAGWSVHKQKDKVRQCTDCMAVICGSAEEAPSEFADLLEEKTYGGLTYPSTLVWCAVQTAESVFRSRQADIMSSSDIESSLLTSFSNCFTVSGLPDCHSTLSDVVARYFRLRIHVFGKWLTGKFKADIVQHGSRSAFCRTKIK